MLLVLLGFQMKMAIESMRYNVVVFLLLGQLVRRCRSVHVVLPVLSGILCKINVSPQVYDDARKANTTAMKNSNVNQQASHARLLCVKTK